MLKNKLKMIINLIVGIPAAIVFASDSEGVEGFMIQMVALALIVLILAVNGVFKRKETDE